MRAKVDRQKGSFMKSFMAAEEPIAQAATSAIAEAADQIKVGARQQIAGAGFGKKWQDALRVDRYPKGTTSINAAAHVYHKIKYAWVFEEGASISGKPYLWLPLSHVAAGRGRGKKNLTPKTYPGKLQFVSRPGKPPLLMASIGMTKAASKRPVKRLSAAAMRKGASGGGAKGVVRSVPVFVGISTMKLRKQFEVEKTISRAANQLGALYMKHLRVDD